jgi:hypothetical protein
MENLQRERVNLNEFTPVNKKDCQNMCERDVLMTKNGPVIICHACKRIVMDNRNDH